MCSNCTSLWEAWPKNGVNHKHALRRWLFCKCAVSLALPSRHLMNCKYCTQEWIYKLAKSTEWSPGLSFMISFDLIFFYSCLISFFSTLQKDCLDRGLLYVLNSCCSAPCCGLFHLYSLFATFEGHSASSKLLGCFSVVIRYCWATVENQAYWLIYAGIWPLLISFTYCAAVFCLLNGCPLCSLAVTFWSSCKKLTCSYKGGVTLSFLCSIELRTLTGRKTRIVRLVHWTN